MKKFFSRSTTNELFICDNSKVKNAIEKWLKPAGWSYDDFPKFLKLLHIPTPLKVIEVNSTQECVFKCLTSNDKIINIKLVSETYTERAQIFILDGNTLSCYKISDKSDDHPSPKIFLSNRKTNNENVDLDIALSFDSCEITLKFVHACKLTIVINTVHTEKFNPLLLANNNIENTLLDISSDLSFEEIYNAVFFNAFNFSEDDINGCKKISISNKLKDNWYSNTITLSHGNYEKYSTWTANEAIEVSKNGNWTYSSDKLKIRFCADNNHIEICSNCAKNELSSVLNIKTIEEKVKNLRKKAFKDA